MAAPAAPIAGVNAGKCWHPEGAAAGSEEAAGPPHAFLLTRLLFLSEAGGQKPVSPQGSWWGDSLGPLWRERKGALAGSAASA